jgi:hypothetical protein
LESPAELAGGVFVEVVCHCVILLFLRRAGVIALTASVKCKLLKAYSQYKKI